MTVEVCGEVPPVFEVHCAARLGGSCLLSVRAPNLPSVHLARHFVRKTNGFTSRFRHDSAKCHFFFRIYHTSFFTRLLYLPSYQ